MGENMLFLPFFPSLLSFIIQVHPGCLPYQSYSYAHSPPSPRPHDGKSMFPRIWIFLGTLTAQHAKAPTLLADSTTAGLSLRATLSAARTDLLGWTGISGFEVLFGNAAGVMRAADISNERLGLGHGFRRVCVFEIRAFRLVRAGGCGRAGDGAGIAWSGVDVGSDARACRRS